MAQGLSIWTVLLPAAIGGVFAAFVNQGLKWAIDTFTENKKTGADSTYLAMRVAVIMEAFVSACDAHLRDRDVAADVHGISEAGKLPLLADFPADIDWRSCDSSLGSEILGFPTRIASAQSDAYRASWESNDFWVTHTEAVNLAVAAWDIAERLRAHYKLPPNGLLAPLASALLRKKSANDSRQAAQREKWLEDAEKARTAVRSGAITPVNS
ncbi:hypothetical protein [Bosea sp. TAB14]|uniref:hypothetical protein n=1 Tax=Bosea sp. TAB14 TaxID=3237481 RepID=UPI003F930AB6